MRQLLSKKSVTLFSLLLVSITAWAVIDYKGDTIRGVGQLSVDNVRIDGNTISTLNTNGNLVLAPNGTGVVTGTFSGNLTGNADTSTALANNPADCSVSQFANAISANGDLSCDVIDLNDLSGVASIAQGGTNNGSLGVTAGGMIYTDGSKLMNTGAGTTGQIMTSNAAGAPTWQAAPAGGTNDQKEYVTNGKFETDVTGWTTYDDAAAAPVDGTGGTVTTTFARTTTTAEIIRETGSGELQKDAANRQGEGVCVAFTMDRQEAAGMKATPVSFEYQTTANYASGDVLVYAIDVTAATVQAVQTIQSTTAGTVMASSTPTRWNGVIHPTTTNTSYKLCLHIATTNASAWDMHVDSVHVGNQNVTPGPIVADLGTETWTDNETNSTTSVKLSRDGQWLLVEGVSTASGAFSQSQFQITIPSAYTPDPAIYPSPTTKVHPLGQAIFVNNGNSSYIDGRVYTVNANALFIGILGESGTYSAPVNTTSTAPFTWASGDKIMWQARWRVSNWSASAALSTTETMLSTQVFAAYRNGALSINNNSSTTVSMDVVEIDNLNSLSSGKFVAKRTGKYLISGNVTFAASTFTSVQASISKNAATTVASGVNLPDTATSASQSVSIPPKVVSLVAGDTLELVGYQTNGGAAARSISTGAATTYLSVNELPDFSIFSVYGQTEYSESINSTAGTNWPFSAGFWGDLTSLTLQPGEYDMTAMLETTNNGAVTTGNVAMGISTTSGNSGAGLSTGVNRAIVTNVGTTSYAYTLTVPNHRVVVTTPTTYYLKGICVNAITNFQHTGYRISARRVK